MQVWFFAVFFFPPFVCTAHNFRAASLCEALDLPSRVQQQCFHWCKGVFPENKRAGLWRSLLWQGGHVTRWKNEGWKCFASSFHCPVLIGSCFSKLSPRYFSPSGRYIQLISPQVDPKSNFLQRKLFNISASLYLHQSLYILPEENLEIQQVVP